MKSVFILLYIELMGFEFDIIFNDYSIQKFNLLDKIILSILECLNLQYQNLYSPKK